MQTRSNREIAQRVVRVVPVRDTISGHMLHQVVLCGVPVEGRYYSTNIPHNTAIELRRAIERLLDDPQLAANQ